MNITSIQCQSCSAPLRVPEDAEQVRCDYCGNDQAIERKREPVTPQLIEALTLPAPAISSRSQLAAFALCILLGAFGVHRFYTGHITYGLIQLLTLGGLGIWQLIDLVRIGLGRYRDVNGLPLRSDNPALPRGCLLGLLAFFVILCVGSFMASALLGIAAGGEPISNASFSTAFNLLFLAAVVIGVCVVVWVVRVSSAKKK